MEGRGRKEDWMEESVEQPGRLYKAGTKLVRSSGANIAHQSCLQGAKIPCLVRPLDRSLSWKGMFFQAPEADPDVADSHSPPAYCTPHSWSST